MRGTTSGVDVLKVEIYLTLSNQEYEFGTTVNFYDTINE